MTFQLSMDADDNDSIGRLESSRDAVKFPGSGCSGGYFWSNERDYSIRLILSSSSSSFLKLLLKTLIRLLKFVDRWTFFRLGSTD